MPDERLQVGLEKFLISSDVLRQPLAGQHEDMRGDLLDLARRQIHHADYGRKEM